MITKKRTTKTRKRASKLKEKIIRKGTTKIKKRASKFKEMIIRKGMTKTRKKMITTKRDNQGGKKVVELKEGDDQDQEEDDYHGQGQTRP
jgi:hypothetical protein